MSKGKIIEVSKAEQELESFISSRPDLVNSFLDCTNTVYNDGYKYGRRCGFIHGAIGSIIGSIGAIIGMAVLKEKKLKKEDKEPETEN